MQTGKVRHALLAAGVCAFITGALSPLIFIGAAARSANVHQLPLMSMDNAKAALPLFGVSVAILFIGLLAAAVSRRDG